MANKEVKDISDVIGTMRKYQIVSLIVTLHASSMIGTSTMFVQFMAPQVDLHWMTTNASDHTGIETTWDSTDCRMQEIYDAKPNPSSRLIYYSKYSHSTITQKFNLVCEESWLVSLATALVMVGAFSGPLAFGRLAENFGRRRMTTFLIIPTVVSNLLILWSFNYIMFAVGCFVYGATSYSVSISSYVTFSEFLSIKLRPQFGALNRFGIVLGQQIVPALCWIFKDWYHAQIAHVVYLFIGLPLAWFVLESPVWLTVTGNEEKARKNLKVIIKRNGLSSPFDDEKISQWIALIQKQSVLSSDGKGTWYDLVEKPTIRKQVFAVFFVLIAVNFAYYGFLMNMEMYATSLYIDFVISGSVAILSAILYVVCLKFGMSVRKFLMASGIPVIIVCAIFPIVYEIPLAVSVIPYVARLFMTAPLCATFIYTVEVLPTSVRSVGLGVGSSLSKLFTAICPFMKELGNATEIYVPVLLFGALNLGNSLLLWKVLPETKGKPFFNTVNDLENEAKLKKTKLQECPAVYTIRMVD